ncbi:hypothetical protein RKE29_10955 [Streptomyces sp. B1866]|uniref:hypothetical protein n=1 Tax=Streptomyces sp. B1866 TaxID=3075431 RepID=UPI00288DB496|nr:hypothetical protein [Streptomyces sp. B1866]MDT3397157.1 hypothetical protein [Streptomyces sp. B1866]
MNPEGQFLSMIDRFLSGQDQSTHLVSEIEDVLVQNFLDTEISETLAEPIALYRPQAGLPYTDEKDMADALAVARNLFTGSQDRAEPPGQA